MNQTDFVAFRSGSVVKPSLKRLKRIETISRSVLVLPSSLKRGFQSEPHQHERGQFLYSYCGRYGLIANKCLWSGTRQQGIWVPPHTYHQVYSNEETLVYSAYVNVNQLPDMPKTCTVVDVPPLLRELIAYCEKFPRADDKLESYRRRTLRVLADQIRLGSSCDHVYLPISRHPRIQKIMEALIENPGDHRSFEDWVAESNLSARSLSRLFQSEAGMSFGNWRRNLRVIEAISKLDAGESVLSVALDMGYTSQSAFTAMFRRVSGDLPSRFSRRSSSYASDVVANRMPCGDSAAVSIQS